MPPKASKKPTKELSMTYSACRMRELRARRKAQDEADMLQKQREYQKHYNTEYINIRKNKPDYSKDKPFQYQNLTKMKIIQIMKILHITLIQMRIKIRIQMRIKIL